MDESILYPNVCVRVPLPIPSNDFERETLSKNPQKMLSISLSRKERLPKELHQAMVLWSFHPDFHQYTKLYFEWVDVVEKVHRKSWLQKVKDWFLT